jgi:hypothetical protein
MTYRKFLERLRKTPRDWQVDEEGRIRRGYTPDYQCPITAAFRSDLPVHDFEIVAVSNGLSSRTAYRIVIASDNLATKTSVMRKEILAACGLGEEKSLKERKVQ